MIKTIVLIVIGVLLLFFIIGVITGGPTKREGSMKQGAAADIGDLLGLAQVELPKGFEAMGLADAPGPNENLSATERLERHLDDRAAVFRFAKDRRNDLGGHARDPILLNVVLLNPVERDPDPLLRFSIERYYSPTGSTIPLDDPRWRSDADGTYQWRWLEMDDHFGTDNSPRWAIVLYDPSKHVRLDFFAWRKRYSLEAALDLLRTVMASVRTTPLLATHFDRTGTPAERLERSREANIARFFTALEPLGVQAPASGGISFGTSTAAWIDDDRRALRVLHILARIPEAADFKRDPFGRPVVPLRLKRGQYPGPTRDGLPSLYLGMLYFDSSTGRWHRSFLQYPSAEEQHPLLPFEDSICARLDPKAIHVVLSRHYYQPYALDDAREIDAFLADRAKWQQELLNGRIVAKRVTEARIDGAGH